MLITVLTAALMLAQDAPKAGPGAPLPPAPTGPAIAMPDIGTADPDAVCFVGGTFLVRDTRQAGKDSGAADMETVYFAGIMIRRYDDTALIKVMDAAKGWVTGKPLDALHAACHDRYARDMQRLRVANDKSN